MTNKQKNRTDIYFAKGSRFGPHVPQTPINPEQAQKNRIKTARRRHAEFLAEPVEDYYDFG